MWKLVLALFMFIAFVEPLRTQDLPKKNPFQEELKARKDTEPRVVLRAVPKTLVVSNWSNTLLDSLTAEQRQAQQVIIVKVGESYYWASRDNRELIYSKSGLFHNFTDAYAGAVVKVFVPSEHPAVGFGGYNESYYDKGSNRVQFFECTSFELTTYTYWRTASEFNPWQIA
ncbi:MAG: hypothetical protein OXH06_18005 [Gemmatimonadetes bacterium]|nr:hypothetical protein [Gemmatimonadota bacterium]